MSQSLDFVGALFGSPLPVGTKVALWSKGDRRSVYLNDPSGAAMFEGAVDLYVSGGLVPDSVAGTGPHTRLKARDCAGIPGVWIDVDVNGGPENKQNAADNRDAATALTRIELEPTVLVNSGYGVQAWWLFDEPWLFGMDQERDKAQRITQGWETIHRNHARCQGHGLDSTHDLARLMRLPGTLNGKGGLNVPVEIVTLDGPRYSLETVADRALTVVPANVEPGTVNPHASFPHAKFEGLIENHDFFRRTWQHRREDREAKAWSMSEYDLALASIAVGAEWSNDEIAALIREHRVNHDGDVAKAERSDYLQKTLEKARTRTAGRHPPSNLPVGQAPGKANEGELAGQQFFAGTGSRRVFVPKLLGDALMDEMPVAVGGEALYVYSRGAYRSAGEHVLALRIAQLLDQLWRKTHAEQTIAYLRAIAPRLAASPPLGQVNCVNGILDVATRRLEPHTAALLTCVQIPVNYDAEATCPAIDAFLSDLLPDAPTVRIAHELAGYLMVPDNRWQIGFMLLGHGENGKSKFLQLLSRFIGEENVSTVALHKVEDDRFAAADLYGRLANIYADLDGRALRSTSSFKAITGGDRMRAERKFRPAFDFVPFARLVFSANEAPPSPDASYAFFRRWVILPCYRKPPKIDRDLLDKLTTPAELSGLLNRALDGLARVREHGFATTEATRSASRRFRVDVDAIAGFIDESCAFDSSARTGRSALFEAYRRWCDASARTPMSRQRFNASIRGRLGEEAEITVNGIATWRGLTIVRGEATS
jgi:P4 family phage/plasmid primase-like protien